MLKRTKHKDNSEFVVLFGILKIKHKVKRKSVKQNLTYSKFIFFFYFKQIASTMHLTFILIIKFMHRVFKNKKNLFFRGSAKVSKNGKTFYKNLKKHFYFEKHLIGLHY